MCVDLSFFSNIEVMADYLPELSEQSRIDFVFEPTYHRIAHAHRTWPVVINQEGQLEVKGFEWGLVDPSMAKLSPKERAKRRLSMVNARSERVLGEGWSVWKGIRHQRCLVPATGFFEHKEIAGRKQSYYIHVKDAAVFFIAGLYHYSPVPDVETGECKGTFTLLTQPSNELLTEIHNSGENRHRMPVMLQPDTLRLWLEPQLADKKMQELLQAKMPAAALEAWPVRSIRQAKEDNQKVIEPIEVSDQASLF